jgi:hypothetical protein
MAGQNTNILAADYNTIQSSIGQVLGTGSGQFGYGQTVLSSQVAVNQKITALQWQNLYNDLITARTHQAGGDQTGNLNYPTTSRTVRESDRSAYKSFADTIVTNKLAVPPTGQGSPESYSVAQKGTSGSPVYWNGTITHSVTLTWASYDTARYFFNTGGQIYFSASFLAGASTLKNNSWATMLNNMGTITFSATGVSYSGSSTGVIAASSTGFYAVRGQTAGTNIQLFQKNTETPLYTPNDYRIYVQLNGPGNVLTFTIQFEDISTGSTENTQAGTNNPFRVDEDVYGALTSAVQGYRATGSYVSVATPSIAASGP